MDRVVPEEEKAKELAIHKVFGGDNDDYEADGTLKPFWKRWAPYVIRFVLVVFFLWLFLSSLDLLAASFRLLAGDSAGSLFEAVNNPIAGVMVGILATVLVQSSSTSTSVIVTAVGTEILPVNQAVPMIMGANIGTSVTNTIVSLGFVNNREQYMLGFSGATVHDMFNYLNVLLLLPIEIITDAINNGNGGILFIMTEAMVRDANTGELRKWDGPIKPITDPFTKKIVSVDSSVVTDFSAGNPNSVSQCSRLCPSTPCTLSEGADPEYAACNPLTGCLAYTFSASRKDCAVTEWARCRASDGARAQFDICENANTLNTTVAVAADEYYRDFQLLNGGIFYEGGVDQRVTGVVLLVLTLIVMSICLFSIVSMLQFLVRGEAEVMLKRALNMNGYLAILVGTAMTVLVQSSSITTSTLTPLVAIGVIELESMFPLTLGANIGTTVSGFLASLASTSIKGLQIALVHLLFNIIGVLIWYPIPRMRRIPISMAMELGEWAGRMRAFPLLYLFMLFLIYPAFLMGISLGYDSGPGGIAASTIALLFVLFAHAWFYRWYKFKDGRATILTILENMETKRLLKAQLRGNDVEAGSSGDDDKIVTSDQ